MNHAMYVPVEGLVRVYNSEAPINAEALLREQKDIHGAYVQLRIVDAGEEAGALCVLVNEALTINPRARMVMYQLTTTHMLIKGDAVFMDIAPDVLIKFLGAIE